jgi:hypothetical protein
VSEQAEPIWHGLPRSTWLWSVYNICFVAYCSFSGYYAVAIIVAALALLQVRVGARKAYWSEQVDIERQKNEELRNG